MALFKRAKKQVAETVASEKHCPRCYAGQGEVHVYETPEHPGPDPDKEL